MSEDSESFAGILASLNDEFIDEARDRLRNMTAIAGGMHDENVDRAAAIQELLRTAHKVKGMATTFQFSAIATIAHMLEDYLAIDRPLDLQGVRDIEVFLDRMMALLDKGVDGRNMPEGEQAALLKSLPNRAAKEFTRDEPRDASVVLVTAASARTLVRFVTRELGGIGYRVTSCGSTAEALVLAARLRPELIISSLEMPDISGIDFCRALAAMEATKGIPFCLLTSYALEDPRLENLPETAAVLRTGSGFAPDLAAAIAKFEIA